MPAALTPQQFVENWRKTELSERASYQAHFMDVRFILSLPQYHLTNLYEGALSRYNQIILPHSESDVLRWQIKCSQRIFMRNGNQ